MSKLKIILNVLITLYAAQLAFGIGLFLLFGRGSASNAHSIGLAIAQLAVLIIVFYIINRHRGAKNQSLTISQRQPLPFGKIILFSFIAGFLLLLLISFLVLKDAH